MPGYTYYPNSNQELIARLDLRRHPEGGYFVETDRREQQVPSPFANKSPRSLATSIYYLLAYDNPCGVIHMNKSVTYHVLHQGRAEYTLITPGNPPIIRKQIMGTDTSSGEVRMLLVGTGIWKMSRLLPEDVESAMTQEEKNHTGCLITEANIFHVVTPGFEWEDHDFMTDEILQELFGKVEGGQEKILELSPFVR